MKSPPICPKCGKEAELVDSKIVYGKSYGPIWYCGCEKSGVYVGCHGGTERPLGTMADASLREFRKDAHKAFDPIWKNNTPLKRWQAYSWLASKMGISRKDCHIAMFDEEQCKEVIKLSNERRGVQ